jgi:hypothetical protein
VYAGIGAAIGAGLVALLLAVDVLGLGAMLIQSERYAGHAALIFSKPMMLCGFIGAGVSLWWQTAQKQRIARIAASDSSNAA